MSIKRFINFFTFLFLLLCTIACSRDDIPEIVPPTTNTETEQIDQEQLEQTNIIKAAAADPKIMVQSIDYTSDGYTIVFSNGTKADIKLKSNGSKNAVYVKKIDSNETEVKFTLTDNTVLTIPLLYAMSVEFDAQDLYVVKPNDSRTVHYKVTSNFEDIKVEVEASQGIKAEVIPGASAFEGSVIISTGDAIPAESNVLLLVSNPGKTISRKILFEKGGLEVYNNTIKDVDNSGGVVKLEFLTNVDCELDIPENYKEWIEINSTRALEYAFLEIKVAPNAEYNREGKVFVRNVEHGINLEFTIQQTGELGEYVELPDFDNVEIPNDEIWYVSCNNRAINFTSAPNIDATLISNTYKDGYGILKFDKEVKLIGENAFSEVDLRAVYLPDGIELIGEFAFYTYFRENQMQVFRVPASLKAVGRWALNFKNLERFIGKKHVTADGRALIVDGVMYSFAPVGLTDYSIPSGVTEIQDGVFADFTNIVSIDIPEGVKLIGDAAFSNSGITSITFPESLEQAAAYAFNNCYNLKGFYGNKKFHTEDNLCYVTNANGYGRLLSQFARTGQKSYTVPAEVDGIENYAFGNNTDLESITLPESVKYVGSSAFEGSTNIEAIYGPQTSSDHRFITYGTELTLLVARKNFPSVYRIPDEITSIGAWAFSDCDFIEEITMGDQVVAIGGYAFSHCDNLKKLTLSANLQQIGPVPWNPIMYCSNIEEVYIRALLPPKYSDTQMTDYPKLKMYVPEQSLELYKEHSGWSIFKDHITGYNYGDLPKPNIYYSTDFSKDGTVVALQKASSGNGIDVVLMGDGYSDRMIASGEYESDMRYLYDNLFTIEPYTSFKDLFNVYYVNAVSLTEDLDNYSSALGTWFGDLTYVAGNDQAVLQYALKALPEERMNEVMVIVAVNSDRYAGTCFSFSPGENVTSDYGSGPSISYFSRAGEKETFSQVLHHEANGHGFAKLADEYFYDYNGTISAAQVAVLQVQQNKWGWWKNIDFTSDPTQVRWSKFLSDPRYANENIGVYEGGAVYPYGVWRPSETSIMVSNMGEFNAPSREAIYYRIHKLAFGDSWNYDYDEFVKYDLNRTRSNISKRSIKKLPKLHAPVMVKKTWKDVVKNKKK